MKKKILFIIFLLFFASRALAASVFVETPGNVKAGETFSALIKADTDEISINSINVVLSYDKDLLLFSGKAAGSANFFITESLLLKNDGKGSLLTHTQKGATLTIRENPNPTEEKIADRNP